MVWREYQVCWKPSSTGDGNLVKWRRREKKGSGPPFHPKIAESGMQLIALPALFSLGESVHYRHGSLIHLILTLLIPVYIVISIY
jgi:hypothetical protein